MNIMRINQTFIFLLMVVFSFVVQAESSFTPDTAIRKTVDSEGKVVYGKSGFDTKKPVKKPVEPEVKAPPKSTAPKVDIYYASWDPYSNKAIVFFRENHVVVNAYDIDLDPKAAERKKKLDPKFVGMPLVVINGIIIRGVDEKKYTEALATQPQ
jgi:glutaredoxin